jgi:hypothetical protein
MRGGSSDELEYSDEMDAAEWGRLDRTVVLLSFLGSSLQRTVTFSLSDQFIGDTAMRYNQGWIVNRVRFFVPDAEPYAKGETIIAAAVAAVLPRFIAEDKLMSGGRENMARFAAMEMSEGTSMNLGYAGEMYANFGPIGGVIGCGLYALLLGLVFRWICRKAFLYPLWWSIVPFVFFSALKAEDGIAEVLNWTVKSCLILIPIYYLMGGIRKALNGDLTEVTTSAFQICGPSPKKHGVTGASY